MILLIFIAAFVAFIISPVGQEFFGFSKGGEVSSGTPEVTAASSEESSSEAHPLKVYYVDVGQGDCEFVRIPDGDDYFNMLIDCGEAKYRADLIKYLKELGVTRLDAIMVSHPHADHMGGMADIIKSFDIGKIYMSDVPDSQTPTTVAYEKMLDAIEGKDLRIKILYGGDNIELPEGAEGDILGPVKGEEFDELNDYSLVFSLKYSGKTFLFMGDSETPANRLIMESGADMDADVLKVPHHGSAGAGNKTLMRAVSPDYAVICVGAGNDYGHPTEKILNLLDDAGAEVYRTDEDGTVLFECEDGKLSVETGLRSIKSVD